ncbi:MAG: leucine-rich repeat domain-containing protein [Clostridia bacterium]|nr:leucine-rich repeat domain-containing protein [Clostridia bacterium]
MKKFMRKIICLLLSSVCFLFCACVGGEDNRLSTPQNLRAEGKTLVWDEVENALGYVLYIDGLDRDVEETFFDLSFLTEVGSYEIEIIAVGNGEYKDSSPVTFTYKVEEVVSAGNDENGWGFILLEDGESYGVTRGIANLEGDIVLPDYYKGLPVTQILDSAFCYVKSDDYDTKPNPITGYYCNTVTTGIRLPKHLKSIGDWSFKFMIKLEGIVIPDTVTEIGVAAFAYCINLKNVTLPKSLKKISENAFRCCALTELVLPESLEEIGNSAFRGSDTFTAMVFLYESQYGSVGEKREITIENTQKFTKVVIPKSVKRIDICAFADCENLSEIVLPSDLDDMKVDEKAFSNTGVYNNSPNGLICIGNLLYGYKGEMPENCKITVPETVKYISEYAFFGQTNLKSVILPMGLKMVGERIFGKCTSLTEVKLPPDLTKIPEYAFLNCSSLADIEIPDSVTEIGKFAFKGCTALKEVDLPVGLKVLNEGAFCESGLEKIILPAELEVLGKHALLDINLKTIIIPRSLQYLGTYVMGNCSLLESVYYEGSESEWNALVAQENSDYVGEDAKYKAFSNATVYTYSESQPLEAGNYWRYENGVPTVWDMA